MTQAARFNRYAKKIGQRFTQKFPDVLQVMNFAETADSGGAIIYSAPTVQSNPEIPCFYSPTARNRQDGLEAAKLENESQYTILIPAVLDNARVSVQINDRLQVAARGLEPAKVFKVLQINNVTGLLFEIIAELENEF